MPYVAGPLGSAFSWAGRGISKVPVLGPITRGSGKTVAFPFKVADILTFRLAKPTLATFERVAPWQFAYTLGRMVPKYGPYATAKGWLGATTPLSQVWRRWGEQSAGLGPETEATWKTRQQYKAAVEYNQMLEESAARGELLKKTTPSGGVYYEYPPEKPYVPEPGEVQVEGAWGQEQWYKPTPTAVKISKSWYEPGEGWYPGKYAQPPAIVQRIQIPFTQQMQQFFRRTVPLALVRGAPIAAAFTLPVLPFMAAGVVVLTPAQQAQASVQAVDQMLAQNQITQVQHDIMVQQIQQVRQQVQVQQQVQQLTQQQAQQQVRQRAQEVTRQVMTLEQQQQYQVIQQQKMQQVQQVPQTVWQQIQQMQRQQKIQQMQVQPQQQMQTVWQQIQQMQQQQMQVQQVQMQQIQQQQMVPQQVIQMQQLTTQRIQEMAKPPIIPPIIPPFLRLPGFLGIGGGGGTGRGGLLPSGVGRWGFRGYPVGGIHPLTGEMVGYKWLEGKEILYGAVPPKIRKAKGQPKMLRMF